jgi:beta-lactam-binding protein with PASTA domain
MPELVGLSLADAEARLSGTGLHIGKLSLSTVPGALHGTIIAQTPQHGARIDANAAIDLQVAE